MDITKCVQLSTKYINCHANHYKNIFELYVESQEDPSENKSRLLFSDFIKLFIKLQMYVSDHHLERIKCILEDLASYRIIFKQILRTLTLTEHQRVDVLTMIVYMKTIKNLLKGTLLSSSHSTSSHTVTTCATTTTCPAPTLNLTSNKLTTQIKSSPHVKVSKGLKTSKNLGNQLNIIKSLQSNKLKTHHSHTHTNSCHSIDILKKNKKHVIPVLREMKNISHLLSMFNVILSEMQREYLQKINCYNLYDQSVEVNETDIEYHNKLAITSYKQLYSLLTNENSIGSTIFDDSSDTKPIDVFLCDGSTYTICTIDNFRIRSETIDETETIIFDIGTLSYNIKYLKAGLDYDAVIVLMKENFSSIKSVLYAITSNQKIILHWLKVINKILNE